METASKPVPLGKRASVADAKLAYFEGDFDRCLEICSNIRVRTLTAASEVALIEARAYLRTGRPREAQNTIAETLETHATLDASLTAQMLVATARIRQDDADTGIAILVDAAKRSAGAHFAICSEIAFCTALGYWAKRDIAAAETYLELVDPRSDIIHARALELQAWCHIVRRQYQRSADYFRLTLLRLDECQAGDRAIEATAISTLAIFAAELFDSEIARFVEARAQRIDWVSGLRRHHFVTLLHQALFHEFAGNTIEAYWFATQARDMAPTAPSEVSGWGFSSMIAHNAGEAYSAIVFAKRAQQLLSTVDARDLAGEERTAMLVVAQTCAHFDPDASAELLARYWDLAPVDKMLALSGDPLLDAEETFVAGVVAQAKGDALHALACFRKAFDTFREIGYVRRAVLSAHALLKLDADDGARAYISAKLMTTNNFVSKSLEAPQDDRLRSVERHPIVATLPRAQKEVVVLICQGNTNKEIARLRDVGEQTIKNMLTKHVFPAFGVSSRAALVSTCLRQQFGSGHR